MQTDRGIYHKRVCDRCGEVLGGRMMNPDEYFKEWGVAQGHRRPMPGVL